LDSEGRQQTVNIIAVTGDGRLSDDGDIQMIQFNLEEKWVLKWG